MATTPEPISHGFHLMAKPIGPRCNLRCAYCYYLPKQALYPPAEKWRMSDEVLDAYVRQYIDCHADLPEVTFAWQGGEPTLLGVDFFVRAVDLQRQYARPGQRIVNALQTNGVLANDAWAGFFRENGFLVGLSMDGPAELHDTFRLDPQGQPTHERVLNALRLFQRHGVEFNVLCCVSRRNAPHPREVHGHLRELGVQFVQFIPIVVSVAGPPGAVSEHSVTPDGWGAFLCGVFDEWVRRDVGRVFVQLFDVALTAWMGLDPPLCTFAETCGRALVLEHNGDVYSCDHFVTAGHKLGNLLETPLSELVASPRQQVFGQDKRDRRPESCRACPWDFVCHGECPRNRLAPPPGEREPLNYLCEGYRRFFQHAAPYMEQMADSLRNGQPPAAVMQQFT